MRSKILKLLAVAVPLSLVGQDLCDWQSHTRPPPLRGEAGNASSGNYWFEHLSDVDKLQELQELVFVIKNRHATRDLPVEWHRGDATVEVAFSNIAPGRCASNSFQTGNATIEDVRAFIKYGPDLKSIKQNS